MLQRFWAWWTGRVSAPAALSSTTDARKVAIVIGHNKDQPGAVRTSDGVSEYVWNSRLADLIVAQAPTRYVVIRRTKGAGEISRAYDAVDASGAVASVELHFNAAASTAATGTETLSSGSTRSLRLANLMQAEMVAALGLKDRGVKVPGGKDRGYGSLHFGKPPAILIEPYFGSSAFDCLRADQQFAALAAAIHRACMAYLKEV